MSERDQTQSVSQAVQELSAKVETWEAQLGGWGKVISETLLDALEQGAARAEARQQRQAQQWAQSLRGLREGEEVQVGRLSAAVTHHERQAQRWAALTQRLEHQHAPWVWGVSRERWKGLVVTLFVTLGVTLGVATLYHAVGPPAQELARVEEQNASWQALWAVTTEAEREQILKRAGEKRP